MVRPAVLGFVVLLAACGGSGPGRGYKPDAPRSKRLAVVPEEHRPADDTAPIYEAARRGGTKARLTLHPDAALERVAGELVDTIGEDGEPPPVPVVDFAIRWHGLLDPAPMVLLASGPDVAGVAGAIEGLIAESGTLPYNRVGLATFPIPGGLRCLALVSMRYVDAEPVDLVTKAGGVFRLAAKILPPFARPRVVVTSPDESVAELPLADAREFVAQVPLPEPGRYDVEVLAEGERGITVLANFPVWAGVEPPASIEVVPPAPPATDASDVEDELVTQVNDVRRRLKLPALERRTDLDRVARAHGADMVKNRFVGHRSPTTGDPSDRLAKAGIVSGLVLENIGRDYSARALHEGLMRSPGHRANIVSREATHLGVGVVAEPEGDRTAFIATEVYVQFARQIVPANAEREFREILNDRRRRSGAGAVEVDAELSRIARSGAERFFRDRLTQPDVTAAVQEELEPFGLAYRRIGVIVTAVVTIDQAATIERLLERDMTVIGVGIAQGNHPQHGNNAICVVVVLAWPR